MNNQCFFLILKKMFSLFGLTNQFSEKSSKGGLSLTVKFLAVFFVVLLIFAEPSRAEKKQDGVYTDMGNGTIKDDKHNRSWTKTGSFFELKKWLSWEMSKDYAKKKNKEKFGGFSDWRLPTRKELKSLFDRRKKGKWTYEKSERFYISAVFELAYCYFWTSEGFDDKLVWQVSLCNGRAYTTGPNNYPGNSVLLVRP